MSDTLAEVIRNELIRATLPPDPVTGQGGMGLTEDDLAAVILDSDWLREIRREAWAEGANEAVEPYNTGTHMTLRAVIPFPENPY